MDKAGLAFLVLILVLISIVMSILAVEREPEPPPTGSIIAPAVRTRHGCRDHRKTRTF
ncbi:exopeptide [Sinorhizobium medicae]|uniref:Exopeptide n=1 Tax=Sinorhizobium medicae TaxID=110321 RepID=A0A508WTM8_9HYPH|nr:exopeptide [Sinorhizobium medicae]MDX0414179.1 exopeptide [Sinorhizobium medicae]MDX0420519.1 exopeptide [Sinorhizobium medicae]MDX0426847.1 exopeptide [Sinorhizobium medicae]MDX0432723.1 exopeptide [Sinorhizobium medicae]